MSTVSTFEWLLGFAFVSFLVGLGASLSGVADIRWACGAWGLALLLGVVAVWQHEPFSAWPIQWKFAISIIIISLVVAASWGPTIRTYQEQRAKRLEGLEAPLTPANEPDPQMPAMWKANIPTGALKILFGADCGFTTKQSQVILRIAKRNIISLTRGEGGVLIDASVFGADNRIVTEIVRNHFYVNPNNYFRIERPDNSSLIVYDQQAVKVLDVRFVNSTTIRVLGIFRYGKSPVVQAMDHMNVIGNQLTAGNLVGDTGAALFDIE